MASHKDEMELSSNVIANMPVEDALVMLLLQFHGPAVLGCERNEDIIFCLADRCAEEEVEYSGRTLKKAGEKWTDDDVNSFLELFGRARFGNEGDIVVRT